MFNTGCYRGAVRVVLQSKASPATQSDASETRRQCLLIYVSCYIYLALIVMVYKHFLNVLYI